MDSDVGRELSREQIRTVEESMAKVFVFPSVREEVHQVAWQYLLNRATHWDEPSILAAEAFTACRNARRTVAKQYQRHRVLSAAVEVPLDSLPGQPFADVALSDDESLSDAAHENGVRKTHKLIRWLGKDWTEDAQEEVRAEVLAEFESTQVAPSKQAVRRAAERIFLRK